MSAQKTMVEAKSDDKQALLSVSDSPRLMIGSQELTFTDGVNSTAFSADKMVVLRVRYTGIKLTSIVLNKQAITCNINDEADITVASYEPADADDASVTYSSSDASIVQVDANGHIKALKEGKATITVTAADGSGVTAQCEITVNKPEIKVTAITLNNTTLKLTEGGTSTLTATVQPTTATNKAINWTSSNTSVATVNNGTVTAVAAGTATITATAADGSGVKATCAVTVEKAVVKVTTIILNNTTLKLTEGGTSTLTATVQPTTATNKAITWTSSNTSVATVSNGTVTAVAAGTATITATAADGSGVKATCAVTVEKAAPATSGKIYYTSSTRTIVKPSSTAVFGANIVSNTYKNGQGVIEFDGDVTTIGTMAFNGCSTLTSITIPKTVTSFGDSPFNGCPNIASFTVESGNTKYDSRDNCNAIIETKTNTLIHGCKNTLIPNTVKTIASHAFNGRKGLKTIIIPTSVTSIAQAAFYECNDLATIDIPNSVKTIEASTFRFCTNLTSVTIPSSVTKVNTWAFDGCRKLKTVFCEALNPPTAADDAFAVYGTLYVYPSAQNAYKSANVWNKFTIDDNISGLNDATSATSQKVNVFSLDGKLLRRQVDANVALEGLDRGTYIVNGKKISK